MRNGAAYVGVRSVHGRWHDGADDCGVLPDFSHQQDQRLAAGRMQRIKGLPLLWIGSSAVPLPAGPARRAAPAPAAKQQQLV